MPQTVIYGPPATGKSFHAAAFAKLYGCDCVADDHGGRGGKSFRPITVESALILSTSEPADLRKRYPAATLVRIDAARSALGLDPAPVDGFKPPYHDKAAYTPLEEVIPHIDLDVDTVRQTLAQLPCGFTLTEAATALSVNAPHRSLRELVMRAGFQPFMERRGATNTRCWFPISKEARAAVQQTGEAPAITTEQDRRNRMAACPCACHENRCGSADIAMAQYALALVSRCSNADDAGMIHELVQRAGPAFARVELMKLRAQTHVSTDEEVPF